MPSQPKTPRSLPLRLVLIVPFIAQIIAAVGLTGYFSIRNGQKAVNEVAGQLRQEVTSRVKLHLTTLMAKPIEINQMNARAIALDMININDRAELMRHFWNQSQSFGQDVPLFIYFGNAAGGYAGAGLFDLSEEKIELAYTPAFKPGDLYSYAADPLGHATTQPYYTEEGAIVAKAYDARQRPWYQDAVAAQQAAWTDVYIYAEGILGMTASQPLYDPEGELLGVASVDFSLAGISTFLRQLEVGETGKVFILEREGFLVGSSTDELPYVEAPIGEETEKLLARESKIPLIRQTARSLEAQFQDFAAIATAQQLEFQVAGQRHFAMVSPFQDDYGLDWLIVVVVPESDFMAQIAANTRTTIFLCLGALGLAIALGVLTARWISRPIVQLDRAAAQMAMGQLNQQVQMQGIKEVQTLARSFNTMARQLREAFSTLEQKVAERTAELAIAKDQADAANQAKSEFLANMSHELRTPLNGILGYAQILGRDRQATPQQKDGVRIIQQCGTHLLNLINDVLDLAKIEARKLELLPNDFDLTAFLKGVVEIARLKAEQKEIAFVYAPLNALPDAVQGDEKRLRQVLLNLLGNAIKFTERGQVTLKVGQMGSSEAPSAPPVIRFQVEDTGAGMTSEQVAQLFEPFEQVGAKERQAEGTGLGLAISRQIVEMMGGTLQVESTPNQGSRFWFELELMAVENWQPTAAAQSTQIVVSYAGARRKILVVDDRWENRAVIVNLLEPLGFELYQAENGEAGLTVAQRCQPDLILTDLVMPEMNGFEMTQALRAQPEFRDIPILASSASVFNFDRQKSQAVGCSDFLPKPVQLEELLAQLQSYLQIQWIVETPKPIESVHAANLVLPPASELVAIQAALKIGDFDTLEAEGQRLAQLASEYIPFGQQLQALAHHFDEAAIAQLLTSLTPAEA
ncbi:MAG: ATP-binding protein [Cyanobacteria bacterium P01_G01_bin.54]